MDAQTTETPKMVALLVIQLAGTLAALASTFDLQQCAQIDAKYISRIRWVLMLALAVTVLLFTCHQEILPSIMAALFDGTRKCGIPFACVICAYATIDLGALAYLIYATGGSRHSLFVPFLLIIVPVTTMLQDSGARVVLYFGATWLIFAICLFLRNREFKIDESTHRYDLHYFGITAICVMFPTCLKLFASQILLHNH